MVHGEGGCVTVVTLLKDSEMVYGEEGSMTVDSCEIAGIR